MTSSSSEIVHLSPHEVKEHSCLSGFPGLTESQYQVLLNSVERRGILAPVTVGEDHRLLDGRSRVRAARELGIEEIPAIVRNELDPLDFVFDCAITGRQFSKSAIAILLAKKHPELAARRGKRGNPNFQIGIAELEPTTTYVEISKKYGVSTKYLSLAVDLRAKLSASEWAELEVHVFEQENDISRFLSGEGSRMATTGKKRVDPIYFCQSTQGWKGCLFRTSLVTIKNALSSDKYATLPHEVSALVKDELASVIASLPSELKAYCLRKAAVK
jgi:hypothetical protein